MSCRTKVFEFMDQRILIQHLVNYCCVVRVHKLIVIVSCRTSEQEVDNNQLATDLIIPNKLLVFLKQNIFMILLKMFQMGFQLTKTYMFFWRFRATQETKFLIISTLTAKK